MIDIITENIHASLINLLHILKNKVCTGYIHSILYSTVKIFKSEKELRKLINPARKNILVLNRKQHLKYYRKCIELGEANQATRTTST